MCPRPRGPRVRDRRRRCALHSLTRPPPPVCFTRCGERAGGVRAPVQGRRRARRRGAERRLRPRGAVAPRAAARAVAPAQPAPAAALPAGAALRHVRHRVIRRQRAHLLGGAVQADGHLQRHLPGRLREQLRQRLPRVRRQHLHRAVRRHVRQRRKLGLFWRGARRGVDDLGHGANLLRRSRVRVLRRHLRQPRAAQPPAVVAVAAVAAGAAAGAAGGRVRLRPRAQRHRPSDRAHRHLRRHLPRVVRCATDAASTSL